MPSEPVHCSKNSHLVRQTMCYQEKPRKPLGKTNKMQSIWKDKRQLNTLNQDATFENIDIRDNTMNTMYDSQITRLEVHEKTPFDTKIECWKYKKTQAQNLRNARFEVIQHKFFEYVMF